jgi:hypothetical protein
MAPAVFAGRGICSISGQFRQELSSLEAFQQSVIFELTYLPDSAMK